MNKKFIILIALIFLFSLGFVNKAKADFPETHVTNILIALQDPTPSYEKDLCRDNLRYCIAGNLGTDSAVVYYLVSETRKKYHGTHSLLSYQNCVRLAGSDDRKRAYCIGKYLHLIEDKFSSHEGYTPPQL